MGDIFVITVIPISKGSFKERLSYFSTREYPLGSVVMAPLKNRTIPALVESCQHGSGLKSEIKQAEFMTRKLDTEAFQLVFPAVIKAVIKTADYYMCPLGSVLKAIIPEAILSDIKAVQKTEDTKHKSHEEKLKDKKIESAIINDTLTLQSSPDNRFSTYKSLVREEFARKKSIIIVCPTVREVKDLYENLKKGIDTYSIILHSQLTKKQQKDSWKKAVDAPHPILIITTPSFISIPRSDISTIIVEHEASRSYKREFKPWIDYRYLIDSVSSEMKARLIYADTLLRAETAIRRASGEIADLNTPNVRLENLPESIILDMNEPEQKIEQGSSSKIISEELFSMIEYAIKRKEKMFIFCARKGLSPQTVCGHCGQSVVCDRCSAPVVLHNDNKTDIESEKRFFLCHHCGDRRSAMEACKKCGSWKLVMLGIGIDKVEQEIKALFPKITILKIDRDVIQTEKELQKAFDDFSKSEVSVMIGTEFALSGLPKVNYSAVASFDSLFSLPDFRINERIAQILIQLVSKTEKYILVQTRNPKASVLEQITKGSLAEFHREEKAIRKQLSYPPYSTLIKITLQGERSEISGLMEHINESLAEWSPSVFPAFISTQKGQYVLHCLIKIPSGAWPNNDLKRVLSSLPENAEIRIDPESLL